MAIYIAHNSNRVQYNYLNMTTWFSSGAIYRRKGEVGGRPRGPHHVVAWPEVGPCHPMVWPPPSSSPSPLWTPSSCQQIGTSAFVSSNSKNISFGKNLE
jgi:hypothetical protein